MPWCIDPIIPALPVWVPGNTCPAPLIISPVQPGAPGGNPVNIAAGDISGAVSSGVQKGVQAATGQTFPDFSKLFNWFSGSTGADHWKGIGLLAAAAVLGIVGVMLWTGKGEQAIKVSTTTGMRST